MRLLLVESCHENLMRLALKVEALSQEVFDRLQLEVSLVNERELLGSVRSGDTVLLGVGLEGRAADIAHEVYVRSAAITIFIFISEQSFAKGSFRKIDGESAVKVFPENAGLGDLEAELLAFPAVRSAVAPAADSLFIAKRYEIVRCLGSGSFGLVYLCRHRELTSHQVAVKVLHADIAKDARAAARFRNEIFASYAVSHPNVARAYEYLRDGDLTAFTMEYVDGGDLTQRLDAPQPLPDVLRILSELCAGLQAIHDAGMIHRNLKPENILLTLDGSVKIADFCCAHSATMPNLIEQGGITGTIDYVSPEYMLNGQVDWRTDIYAVGILAFEMATGKSPFRGDSVYATMTKRLKSEPEAPLSMRPDCSQAFNDIILKALARDPEQRFQSAAEMHNALRPLRGAQAAAPLSLPIQ